MNTKIADNIGLDLVRATETAALTAGRWMGLGQPYEADAVATTALLSALKEIDIDGCIAVGEDQASRARYTPFENKIGTGSGPRIDIVIDAVDGINQLAKGYPGALSVIAVAPDSCMWAPANGVYMDKIVVNDQVAPYLVPECINAPAAWTLALVARAKNKKISDLTVFLLDRPRHQDLIDEIRAAGARVLLRTDGDISMGIQAAMPKSRIDILMGAGGIPEGLILACAVKAFGGAMLGKLDPQSPEEQEAVEKVVLDPDQVLTVEELVKGDEIFFAATGITGGSLLDRVHYEATHATTNSLMLRGETHTQRRIITQHFFPLDQ
jgi:fructose-1,6-bisphosphatase II